MLLLQHFVLSHPRHYKNIRRNTRTQKLPLHLPAVFGKCLAKRNGMPPVRIRNLIHGIHEALLFNVFHGVYPEPALILSRHNFQERYHHNFVTLALTEDMGKDKPGCIHYIRSVRGEAGKLDYCGIGILRVNII